MEFYIGQIFDGIYPPEAAQWCNERGDCFIEEIETVDEVRQFQIVEIPQPTEEELVQAREDAFYQEFFNTSLGYIRRKVTMANGDVKDFLSDLLPTIAMGIQLNQPVTIICYDKPDFSADITDWKQYQHTKAATVEFVQECFMQLNQDFTGVDVSKPDVDNLGEAETGITDNERVSGAGIVDNLE